MTIDHKPNDTKEQERIESMGGEVYKKPNDACFRVYHKDSGSYGLAMSRSLGDF